MSGCKHCLPMEKALLGGGVLHVLSRKLLLWKLVFDKNCRGISLITQVSRRRLSDDEIYPDESFGSVPGAGRVNTCKPALPTDRSPCRKDPKFVSDCN